MSFRPPREPRGPHLNRSQRKAAARARQREMADRRDNRYPAKSTAVAASGAAGIGLPDRAAVPATVVTAQGAGGPPASVVRTR